MTNYERMISKWGEERILDIEALRYFSKQKFFDRGCLDWKQQQVDGNPVDLLYSFLCTYETASWWRRCVLFLYHWWQYGGKMQEQKERVAVFFYVEYAMRGQLEEWPNKIDPLGLTAESELYTYTSIGENCSPSAVIWIGEKNESTSRRHGCWASFWEWCFARNSRSTDLVEEKYSVEDWKTELEKFDQHSRQLLDRLPPVVLSVDNIASVEELECYEAIEREKQELKERYNQFYKKRALEDHPDKIGGDEQKMQQWNLLKEQIKEYRASDPRYQQLSNRENQFWKNMFFVAEEGCQQAEQDLEKARKARIEAEERADKEAAKARELERQATELERQATELEQQATELEQQATELEREVEQLKPQLGQQPKSSVPFPTPSEETGEKEPLLHPLHRLG